jgi:cytochrome c1
VRLRALAVVVAAACAAPLAACGSGVPATSALPGADRGRAPALLRQFGCGSCHAIGSVRGADGLVGPSLTDFRNRRTIAGRLANTPENLVRWLLDPQRVKPRDAMPDVGLGRRDARDIAAFLEGA